jgi:hypothetical protein
LFDSTLSRSIAGLSLSTMSYRSFIIHNMPCFPGPGKLLLGSVGTWSVRATPYSVPREYWPAAASAFNQKMVRGRAAYATRSFQPILLNLPLAPMMTAI